MTGGVNPAAALGSSLSGVMVGPGQWLARPGAQQEAG